MGSNVVYTLHASPADYPGEYVVQRHLYGAFGVRVASPPHCVAATLAEARASIPPGLARIPRSPDDPPSAIESYLDEE
mgnify:CR=1 FL=1